MAQLIGTSLNLSLERLVEGFEATAEVVLLLAHVDYAIESEFDGHTVTMGKGGVSKVLRPDVVRFRVNRNMLNVLIENLQDILVRLDQMTKDVEEGGAIILSNQ